MSTGSTPGVSSAPDSGGAVGQQHSVRRVEKLIREDLLEPERVRKLQQIQVIGPRLPRRVSDTLARRKMAGLPDPELFSPAEEEGESYKALGKLVSEFGVGVLCMTFFVWAIFSMTVGAEDLAQVTGIVGTSLGAVLLSGGALSLGMGYRTLAHDPLHINPYDQLTVFLATQTVGWSETALKDPPPEAAIVLVAHDIITGIRTSPVWADQSLDVHRIRLDLAEEHRQILTGAYRLSQFTTETVESGSVTGTGFDVDRLQAALDQRAGLTRAMRKALVERVAALYRYREGLRPLEALLHDIELVRKLDAEQTELGAADTDIVNNEHATAHLAELSSELIDLEAGLLARIDYLRTGVINSPALATPLTVAPAPEGQ